jgi:four helix bundle protein
MNTDKSMNTDESNKVSSNTGDHSSSSSSTGAGSSSTGAGSSSSSSSTGASAGTLVALEVSYALIGALREIVPVIRKKDRDLADQIQRAASSVALNIAEGQRSMKGNRLKHYSIAHGSANEVKAGLCVARAWGWVDERAIDSSALAILDRLLGLLWGLTHR